MFVRMLAAIAILGSSEVLAGPLDHMERPAVGWTGKVFVPSYTFPTSLPINEPKPWASVDFRTRPEDYMSVILSYLMDGQDKSTWDVANNPARKWYHGPWMGPCLSG